MGFLNRTGYQLYKKCKEIIFYYSKIKKYRKCPELGACHLQTVPILKNDHFLHVNPFHPDWKTIFLLIFYKLRFIYPLFDWRNSTFPPKKRCRLGNLFPPKYSYRNVAAYIFPPLFPFPPFYSESDITTCIKLFCKSSTIPIGCLLEIHLLIHHLSALGTSGIFSFFQIIKNDFFALFIKLIPYFCTSPI